MRKLTATIAVGVVATFTAWPLIAQESDAAQKSGFLKFVEDQISTPDRQISINGLEGALSSDVTIDEITISDEDGVYLTIDNAKLNWNQTALLTGRLQINSLTADEITYTRNANPPEGMNAPSPEAGGFEVPQLPVAVILEELSVPKVTFGEGVFGLGSEISVDGRLVLEGGNLDTDLDITRLDGPGGTLGLKAIYKGESREVDVDVTLSEPEDGVLANLLNIEGKPAVELSIKGTGPLDTLKADLALDADGQRALTGTANFAQSAQGLNVTTDLRGPVADLVPSAYAQFFGQETSLTADLTVLDDGGFDLKSLNLDGGQIVIAASATAGSDGFIRTLSANGRIEAAGNEPVLLPINGQQTKIKNAQFALDFGQGDNWSGTLNILELAHKDLSAKTISLDLDGAAVNLSDAQSRRITFNVDGRVDGISADNPELIEALGTSIGIGAAGLWEAGQPLTIAQTRIAGKALDLTLAGNIAEGNFEGGISLTTPSLAPFSGLADHELGGGIDITADGTIALLTGGFDLELDGQATDLDPGEEALAKILAGTTQLSGRIARTESGINATDFAIVSNRASVRANGRFSSTDANFTLTTELDDLALLTPDASGAASAKFTAIGTEGDIDLIATLSMPQGQLANRAVRDAALNIEGNLKDAAFDGAMTGNASLDGHAVSLATDLAYADEAVALDNLKFETAGTRANGTLQRAANGLLTGNLNVDATDISLAAALAAQEASGALQADITLAPSNGEQGIDVTASTSNLKLSGIAISEAEIDAKIADAFGQPEISGRASGNGLNINGTIVSSFAANATQSGDVTRFETNAQLAQGAVLTAAGELIPAGENYAITLQQARLTQDGISAVLSAPATLSIGQQTTSLDNLRLSIGSGSLFASGSFGDAIDLEIDANSIPLSLANAVQPGLGLTGTLSATASVSGTADRPLARFNANLSGVSASAISSYGLGPISGSASGSFSDDRVQISSLNASSTAGLNLTASGTMPLSGSGGNLSVNGSLPLSLANRQFGNRGTQVSGTANINARVTGSLANPQFNGGITTANAEVIDPLTNLRLQAISASLSLSGDRAIIERFSGNLATGGSVSASGSIGLTGNMPADINIGLNSARYADGTLFVATASGNLALTGPLAGSPTLSGNVQLEKAEIGIPDFGGVDEELIDVNHVAIPYPAERTLARTRVDQGDGSGGSSGDMRLNIAISAPNQIFVRGRGVDAELGGSLQIGGTIGNMQPVGGFELIRGRLTILGQRLIFTSGRVTLVGDLDPYVDLQATTDAKDASVTISVVGPASDLDVNFSSTPQLPQDEILSLLLFDRALGDLSPLQLVRLAAAASELAGGGGNSITDSVRSGFGLDDLDIVSDENGTTTVKAGTYIQDNVYVNVEADAEGKSKISLDLDLTDGVKARASAGSDGETSLGVFYEQDY